MDEMAGMIRHRGPDDEGYSLFDLQSDNYKMFYGEDTPLNVIGFKLRYSPKVKFQYTSENFTVGLAHRRLSIIDLTPAGHQPMCDETGRYWIVYNGEVYNYSELREDLKKIGYSFFSNSDTEVILKSYIAWGEECQNKFNGMWALAIWDNAKKTLWISRDRFGVKPLYYMYCDELFIVCSEIKSIMPIIDLQPNYQEMYAYLLDGQSEAHPETFFDKVLRFPSGHSLTYKTKNGLKGLEFDKYWKLEQPQDDNSFSRRKLKEYSEEYYSLLKDSVRIRLNADVKVSCALSGGLDSSSVTFLAHQILNESGKNTDSLTTVSNVFKNEKYSYCDESRFIDSMLNILDIQNLKSEPDDTQLIHKNDYGLWLYENCYDKMPFSGLNTFKICKDNLIKVNLDGQGADEFNAGYLRYWFNFFSTKPLFSTSYIRSLICAPMNVRNKLRAFLGIEKSSYPGKVLKEEFGLEVEGEYRRKRIVPDNYVGITVSDALNNSITFSLKKMLRNVDFYSMANSVESRQPFMDYRLITFLNLCPTQYKMRNGWTKYLARITFKDKLPAEIVWRKDKLGWPQPTRQWLNGGFDIKAANEIKESSFLLELLKREISDKFVSLLIKQHRPFLRLYNLSRQYEIFFNSGYKKFH